MTTTLPPMGWYTDPADSTQERYWDGQAWTHNLRPKLSQPDMPVQARFQPEVSATGPAGEPSRQRRTPDGVPLAGWWYRVLGYIIDGIVLSVLTWLIGLFVNNGTDEFVVYLDNYLRSAENGQAPQFDIAALMPMVRFEGVVLLVTVCYFTLMYRFAGASIGQLALNMRLATKGNGAAAGPVGLGRAFGRALARTVLVNLPIICLLDWLWAAWDPKSQTLHDKIAGTQVVRVPAKNDDQAVPRSF